MKRTAFLVLLLIAIIPTFSFAEKAVGKPNLPLGYESWPHAFQGSCAVGTNSYDIKIWGTTNTGIKDSERVNMRIPKIETVSVEKINGKTEVDAEYRGGDAPDKPLMVNREYILTNNGWVEFDNTDKSDFAKAQKVYSKMLEEKLSITAPTLLNLCYTLRENITIFLLQLFEKAESE